MQKRVEKYPHLFAQGWIGRKQIKNRIVMSPMVTSLAKDGFVTDEVLQHYEARARGGVGTIIVEAACVDAPVGREGFGQLVIDDPKYIPGLCQLSETIKMHGCAAFIQLLHIGREIVPSMIDGNDPVAPSAIPCKIMRATPRALETEEVKDIVKKFAAAAGYAAAAGFDGIELHAAHGYLINEFLAANTNVRTDEYGGSLENRERFLMECVASVKAKAPQLLISVRLNMEDFVEGGLTLEESVRIGQDLEKAGVHVIHCSCGIYESGLKSIEPASYPEGWRVYMAEALKKAVSIPVITGGIVRRPEMAEEILQKGQADFVFMGRSFLADPEWVLKVQSGKEDEIKPCLNCDICISNVSARRCVACTVNPFLGRENRRFSYFKVQGEKAAVVGGGIAGMQAALTLEEAGYTVTLYEKSDRLGGMMRAASVPPHKEKIGRLQDYLIHMLEKSAVNVKLNTAFGEEDLIENTFDRVVIATGSTSALLPVKGADLPNVVQAVDVLLKQAPEIKNSRVVVIGGGATGVETALYLQENGANDLSVVEMRPFLAMDMEKKNRRDLMNHMHPYHKYVSAAVQEILPEGVKIKNADGAEEVIPADFVVLAVGFKPEQALYATALQYLPRVDMIGDAKNVRSLREAMLEAVMLTR